MTVNINKGNTSRSLAIPLRHFFYNSHPPFSTGCRRLYPAIRRVESANHPLKKYVKDSRNVGTRHESFCDPVRGEPLTTKQNPSMDLQLQSFASSFQASEATTIAS
jgi:hypothetical protein